MRQLNVSEEKAFPLKTAVIYIFRRLLLIIIFGIYLSGKKMLTGTTRAHTNTGMPFMLIIKEKLKQTLPILLNDYLV